MARPTEPPERSDNSLHPHPPSQDHALEVLPEHALLRIVTENAHIGMVIVNRDRRYVYANSTYAEILALPTPNLVGQRVADVLPAVYDEQIRPHLDRAFAGERLEYELHTAGPAGDRYYAVRYEPTTADGAVAFVVVVITDVSSRRRMEGDAGRIAAIVDSSDDAIIGKDLDGIVTSWNGGAERIFGYTAAEMVGTSITRLIPADRQDEEQVILGRIRRGERVQHFETLRTTKDGRVINVSATVSPIIDPSGNIIGASKVARDITARTRAEEEARFQQTMLLTERELTLDGILVVDAESRVLSFNRRFAEMWGVPAGALATRADGALLDAVRSKLRDPEEFIARIRQLYDRHDEASHDEVELADGRIFDRYSAPMRGADGRYYGRVWYFRDITERHQAVEALRTAEERMRFALESADVGIWDRDYLAGTSQMSPILECHHGIPSGTFAGTFESFIAGVDPRDRAQLQETIAKAEKSGADFSTQYRVTWPDGTPRSLASWGRIKIDEAGRPVRGVGIVMDVTENRTLEAQYHQAQKMEAVGRLAGGVAHDFNNLLTAILGYCQLLLDDLDPRDPRRADIMEINKAGESAATLTRQLLTFSRKQIIEPTLIDLNVVVGNLQKMMQRLIGEDVHVVLKLQPELAMVTADSGQAEQIVLNLAVNARDAMPNGGTLTIETSNVELDEFYASRHFSVKPGPYVKLTVSDTGTGMSPEVQARLFEPFFTTKEPGKGTGLGLATVHGIVTRSGGTVGVYSEVGGGTTFAVYLPRAAGTVATAAVEGAPARQQAAGETVLVVDDADGIRELTRRLLERLGYTVLVASGADEGLQLFDRNPAIAVVLTDVVMAGGNGPELARALAERRPGVKVIFMSGYTEDTITHHGVLDPGVAFLHKPFTAQTLGRKIREVLDR